MYVCMYAQVPSAHPFNEASPDKETNYCNFSAQQQGNAPVAECMYASIVISFFRFRIDSSVSEPQRLWLTVVGAVSWMILHNDDDAS